MSYKRVNKTKARKMYCDKVDIYLLPCKVSQQALEVSGSFVRPYIINIQDSKEATNFDRTVNAFEYYNCNSELGRYAHYYIKE